MRLVKLLLLFQVLYVFCFLGCGNASGGFETISAQAAKQLMDTQKDYVIVDVRELSEYKEGHIPKAMLIPLGTIEKNAERVLPNKEQLLLVYCRSGRRSKEAAQIFANKGYKHIKDFGGIISWPYEVVK